MEVELKYEEFSNVVLAEAKQLSDKIIKENEQEFLRISKEYKDKKIEVFNSIIREETKDAQREKTKIVSDATIEMRKEILNKKNQVKEKVFNDVLAKLQSYVDTPEYVDYLIDSINRDKDVFENQEITAFVSEKDMIHKDLIKQKTGVNVAPSDSQIYGGYTLIGNAGNVAINNTFIEKIAEEKIAFNF